MTRIALALAAMTLAGCQDTVTVRSDGPITTHATIVVIVGAADVPRIIDTIATLPAGGAQRRWSSFEEAPDVP